MSVSRALVDCVILSLQDACLFYPCCKQCCSRIGVQQQDTSRCRCTRCGYVCLREQVDHRYRLSLRVTRDACIFGMTVFGACLNSFFGIHASGLHRLVESFEGPVGAPSRSTLLVKAAEDCFIGRRFIFGIKTTEAESELWLRGSANGFGSKDTVQLIATQMILPNAGGPQGCTVVRYYQALLHKATECEDGSSDSSRTTRPPATTLLLVQPESREDSSFSSATLSGLGLFQSMQRSKSPDCTVTPTPPWQQSLGLLTSSAEQEESCCTQDRGEENSRQTDSNKTPRRIFTGSRKNTTVPEETTLSPFSTHSPILKMWSPSPPCHSSTKAKGLPRRQLTQTLLSSSLAWDDLPFSESLTEFLCEENKDVDIVRESELDLNKGVWKTLRNNVGERSNGIKTSTAVCQCSKQTTENHSMKSLCIHKSPALNKNYGHDISQQVCRNPVGYENKTPDMYFQECKQEDEETFTLSSENKEEEQLEEDTYNCSADLFSSSPLVDSNVISLSIHAETAAINQQHPTPVRRELKNKACNNKECMIPEHPQDFIPPSQSTPVGKASGMTSASSYRTLTLQPRHFSKNMPFFESKSPAKFTSPSKFRCTNVHQLPKDSRESTKENLVWITTSSRHRHRLTLKRRFWQPDKHQNLLLTQQHPRIQRRTLNAGSSPRINHKFVLNDCDDNTAIFVPPSPSAKTQLSVKLSRSPRPDYSASNQGSTLEQQQGDGVHNKNSCLDMSFTTSPQQGLVGTGKCESESVEEGRLDGSNSDHPDDESQVCDWSRDLFSDSV